MAAIFFNHLVGQKSPYLLQHVENPVDWYPWSQEALEKARQEKKPILLSIGYSTCHWCHVMAHESFENADIAKIINENFLEKGEIGYLTIHESFVESGKSQRGFNDAGINRNVHIEVGRNKKENYWGSGGSSWGGRLKTTLDNDALGYVF